MTRCQLCHHAGQGAAPIQVLPHHHPQHHSRRVDPTVRPSTRVALQQAEQTTGSYPLIKAQYQQELSKVHNKT